jgi:hypothetical protein
MFNTLWQLQVDTVLCSVLVLWPRPDDKGSQVLLEGDEIHQCCTIPCTMQPGAAVQENNPDLASHAAALT